MKKFTFIFMAILLLCIGAFAQEKGRPLTDSGYDPLGASKVNGSLTTQIPNNGNGAVAFDTYFMNAGAGTVYNTTDGTTNTRACDDKIVGTATTATYQIPMNTYYRYSYVQQIYDAAEIGTGETITEISFQYVWTTSQNRTDFRIYLGNTTKTTFSSSSDWVPLSALQLVRSGPQTFDNTGSDNWVTMQLTTPFTYTGGNLVVAVLNNEGSYYTGSNNTFRFHVPGGNKTLHYYVDGSTPIDPAAPSAGNLTGNRSNIKFKVCTGGTSPINCDPILVGNASSTTGTCRHPFNAYYKNSYSQTIFTPADLGNPAVGSTITSITYNWIYGTPETFTNPKLYMGHTTKQNFNGATGAAAWETPNTLELVYQSSSLTCNNTSPVVIEFTTPFVYQGGNVIVAANFGSNANYLTSDPTWRTTNPTNEMCIFWQSDSEPFNINSPQAITTGYVPVSRANATFVVCTGGGGNPPACLPPTNLNVAYTPLTCEANLTWEPPVGSGSVVQGSLTTQAAGNGYGAVAFDIVAGAQPIKLTSFDTYFYDLGAATVYVYYRVGTSCGNALTTTGWVLVGTQNITVTGSGDYKLATVQMPAPLIIPAGQTYGIYIGTFAGSTGGRVCYYNGGSTCGTLTVSNSALTIKGGTGITSPTGLGTGSTFTERCFAGTLRYEVVVNNTAYNIYRDGAPVVANITGTSYTDASSFDPYAPHTWKIVTACPNNVESDPAVKEMTPCKVHGDCDPPAEFTVTYQPDCTADLSWTPGVSSGGVTPGSITTPVSNNGSGAVAFDIVAGAHDITLTSIETYFSNPGATTVWIYYRTGTACGNATTTNGWILVGSQPVTLTGNTTTLNTIPMPAPLTIPAGQTYGLYIGTWSNSTSDPGRVRYYSGASTCGATTWSNSDLTVKGGHGITGPTALGTGSANTERCFAGIIHYAVNTLVPATYNIYRNNALAVLGHQLSTYTDTEYNPYIENTWCVKNICPNGGESEPHCVTLPACAPQPPCNQAASTVGTTTSYQIPVNTYYCQSYVQEIYDASILATIPAGRLISSIAFDYGYTAAYTSPIDIYMGNTTKTTFSGTTDWVPVSQLQLVFSGTITFAPNSWTSIQLDVPFAYTQGSNLVIALVNKAGSYISSSYIFRTHAATSKTIHIYRDSPNTPIDPAAPPTASGVLSVRNNIRFEACSPSEIDLAALSINGMSSPMSGVSYPYTVVVKNKATNPAENFVVKVLTTNNIELAQFTPTHPLAPGAERSYVVHTTFPSNMEGPLCIKGMVVIEGDEDPLNNSTAPLCITVRPSGGDDIINIPPEPWVGTLSNVIPFDFYYNGSMAQSVYLNGEMGIAGGLVKTISWFYNSTATISKPVNVFMANAPINTLGGQWLPESYFTKVVNNKTVNLPTGLYKLTLTLDEPYLYTGGSLIVMTERIFSPPYTNGLNAYTTSVLPSARTQVYYNDDVPFNWSQSGSSLNVISNVELTMQRVPHGVIRGTVTAYGEPLAGVTISLNQYGITTTTDEYGEYILYFVPAGEGIQVMASKYLYYDVYSDIFDVIDGEEYIRDFDMILREGYIAYGVVQAADGEYIEGATLNFAGYLDNGPILSGVNGTFEFIDVIDADGYTLTVTADGYQKHTSMWDIHANTNMGTIILYDKTYAPSDVVAQYGAESEEYADITWGEPVKETPKTYIEDDGTAENGWAINPNYNCSLGNLFPNTDAGRLTSVDLFTQSNSSNTNRLVYITIFDATRQEIGRSAEFIMAGDTWTHIDLPDIEFEGNFYAMVTWPLTAGYTHYLGFDENGPNANAGFDWYNEGSTWDLLHVLAGGSPGVFLLRVNAMVVEGKKVYGASAPVSVPNLTTDSKLSLIASNRATEAGNPLAVEQKEATRGITGYRLWRLQPGQENTPENWVTLTNVPVNAYEYTDYSFEDVAIGNYKWAVRTVYHGPIESKPAFSNTLAKRYKANFTVNVTTNTFDIPTGAIVTLGTLPPQTVVVNSVIFEGVYYGSYPLKVTLEGFQDYTATVVIDGPGLSHTAKLMEIVKPPFDLKVESVECNTLFTWDHELVGGKKFMYFEVYLDGNKVAEGITGTEYLFTGLPKGTYTAGVAAHYSSGNSEIVTKEFEVTCNGIAIRDNEYTLYPNPTNDHLYVLRANSNPASIDLYNAVGMHIATYETIEIRYKIDVAALAAGTYFIRVTEGANSTVKSFVKNQ